MTTDHRWPPPSVLFVAAHLSLPPLGWLAYGLLFDRRPEVVLLPFVWAMLSVRPVWGLLRGTAHGYGGVIGLLVLVGAVTVGGPLLTAATSGNLPAAAAAGLPLAWALALGFLLYWPDTRRWCGRLPPRPEEDE